MFERQPSEFSVRARRQEVSSHRPQRSECLRAARQVLRVPFATSMHVEHELFARARSNVDACPCAACESLAVTLGLIVTLCWMCRLNRRSAGGNQHDNVPGLQELLQGPRWHSQAVANAQEPGSLRVLRCRGTGELASRPTTVRRGACAPLPPRCTPPARTPGQERCSPCQWLQPMAGPWTVKGQATRESATWTSGSTSDDGGPPQPSVSVRESPNVTGITRPPVPTSRDRS